MGLFISAVRLVNAVIRLSAVTYCIIFSIALMVLTVALQMFQNPNKQ